jgi:ApeA N-terminal domain 1
VVSGGAWSYGFARNSDPRRTQNQRIAGRLGEYGSTHVLLVDLVRTDFSLADDKPGRQSYEAVLCFTNDAPFPANFDPETFSGVRIELTDLEEWLQLDSIEVGYEHRHGHRTEVKVSYTNHEFVYETPVAKVTVENLILGVPILRLSDRPLGKIDIHQTNWLIYEPAKQNTLAELRTAFLRIEEVIALLLGRYFRLDWPNFIGKNGEYETWYKLYSLRGPQGEKLPWSIFLWTTFAALNDTFGSLLAKWQADAEKYEASYGLYMASLRNPLSHPEHDFVNLVWAIESLHRSWQREQQESESIGKRKAKIQEVLGRFAEPGDKKLKDWLEGKLLYAYEPTLEERIIAVFNRLPVSINPVQLRSFAARCARRRNDISHEGGRRPDEGVESFRAEIRELGEALRYLFHALLLHEIGLESDLLTKAMTKSALAERSILPSLHNVQIDIPTHDAGG